LVEIIPDSIIAKSDITSAHFVILEDLYVLSADFGVLPSFLDQTHTPVHHLTRKSRVQSSLCCSIYTLHQTRVGQGTIFEAHHNIYLASYPISI
jgi:hypothetical protein